MSHRLDVEQPATVDDVFALVTNRYPDAQRDGGSIRVTPRTTFAAGTRQGVWMINAPVEREQGRAPQIDDPYGVSRAFPDGLPTGEELDMVHLALSIARRLGGEVETDTGVVLAPHQFISTDLEVVSPYALTQAECLQVVRELIREARPEEAANTGNEFAPYHITAEIFPNAGLDVTFSRLVHPVEAINHVDWVQRGAFSYTVQLVLHDPSQSPGEKPNDAAMRLLREAFLGCAAVAKRIHLAVGGFVLDSEGFLVSPEDLV